MSVAGLRVVTLSSGETIPALGHATVQGPIAACEHSLRRLRTDHLTPEDLAELDSTFPPPNGPRPLEVL